jgi:hypothetical protein
VETVRSVRSAGAGGSEGEGVSVGFGRGAESNGPPVATSQTAPTKNAIATAPAATRWVLLRSGSTPQSCTRAVQKDQPVAAARVMAHAGASEILVSHTVKDLTTGSDITLEDAGERELKGVPDRWHLYRVTDDPR